MVDSFFIINYQTCRMKSRILFTAIFICGFTIAYAGTPPCNDHGKKEDVVGTVIHTDSKKPLKDVSVTVYSTSKKEKEKVAVTSEDGSFSIDELKPGRYRFIFEKTGYKKVTKETVIAKTNDAYQMNIEMIETNDYNIFPSPFHFPDY